MDRFWLVFDPSLLSERDSEGEMNPNKIWERFVFLMSIESFGEKEVIMEGKKQKMFLGSIEKHKKIFDQAVKDMVAEDLEMTAALMDGDYDVGGEG
jgi:hypothetical protein